MSLRGTEGAEGGAGAAGSMPAASLNSRWKQIELFEREAASLRSLDHPGIPRHIDSLEEDSDTDRHFYIVQVPASASLVCPLWAASLCASTQAPMLQVPAPCWPFLLRMNRS